VELFVTTAQVPMVSLLLVVVLKHTVAMLTVTVASVAQVFMVVFQTVCVVKFTLFKVLLVILLKAVLYYNLVQKTITNFLTGQVKGTCSTFML